MTNEQFELLLNPVRLRILQYMAVHRTGVPREMAAYLTDVPLPSLYRHLGKLTEGGVLEVAGEKKVRGTVEKTFRLRRIILHRPHPRRMYTDRFICI